ncbi:hypothetical protein IHP61_13840, partial [Enterococcus faecalis]|nr:hypothetical protein [Enterococcus faecalis]
GEVKIRIPEIENVPAGTYNGFVEWNLMAVPFAEPDEISSISQQSINTAKK